MNEQNQPIQSTPSAQSPWLNRKRIADYYGCNVLTISNLMRRRILPFLKIGRFVRFNVAKCDSAMEKYHR